MHVDRRPEHSNAMQYWRILANLKVRIALIFAKLERKKLILEWEIIVFTDLRFDDWLQSDMRFRSKRKWLDLDMRKFSFVLFFVY